MATTEITIALDSGGVGDNGFRCLKETIRLGGAIRGKTSTDA